MVCTKCLFLPGRGEDVGGETRRNEENGIFQKTLPRSGKGPRECSSLPPNHSVLSSPHPSFVPQMLASNDIYRVFLYSLVLWPSPLSLSLSSSRLATSFDQDRGRYACNGASSRGKYLNEDTIVPGEILWQNSNDTGFRTISRPGNVENLSAKLREIPSLILANYFLIRIFNRNRVYMDTFLSLLIKIFNVNVLCFRFVTEFHSSYLVEGVYNV